MGQRPLRRGKQYDGYPRIPGPTHPLLGLGYLVAYAVGLGMLGWFVLANFRMLMEFWWALLIPAFFGWHEYSKPSKPTRPKRDKDKNHDDADPLS